MCSYLLSVNEHNYYWRSYNRSIPEDALEYEGLYIAQVLYNGLLPATLYPKEMRAVTECEGRRIVLYGGIRVYIYINIEYTLCLFYGIEAYISFLT